jgi:hypothetical protein
MVHGLKWKSYFSTGIPLVDDCEVLNGRIVSWKFGVL